MDLIDAIASDNKNKVFEFLSSGSDVFCCDDYDNISPLHHAVSTGNIEIIFLLLEYGADPYKRYSRAGQTAFELACLLNRTGIASLFCNFSLSSAIH